MNHSTIALIVAACASGLGLSAERARANVTYLYTGNDFTTASAPFTTNDKVMISLTLASALSPDLTVGGVNNVSPLAFTASDGVDAFTDNTALGTVLFSFGTDNVGAVTEWQVVLAVSPQSAAITTRNAFGLDNDFVQHTFNSNGAFNNRPRHLDSRCWRPRTLHVGHAAARLRGLGLPTLARVAKDRCALCIGGKKGGPKADPAARHARNA
jgi:hypothetical protein